MPIEVVVAGSLNMDLVVRAARHPAAGETVAGLDFATFLGGKGYNQATAAARAGSRVAMIGNLGQDRFGDQFEAAFRQDGLDTRFVSRLAGVSTGVANIVVEVDGTNRIIVVPGANGLLKAGQVAQAGPVFEGSRVLVLQLETPLDSSIAAARLAKEAGATVILTPAPVPETPLPPELIELVDLVLPNQIEALHLAHLPPNGDYSLAAKSLLAAGWRAVIVTLGSQGAAYYTPSKSIRVPGFPVEVVDTTAAGDAFTGALATSLARSQPLETALLTANAAGALACTRHGSAASLPMAGEIEAFLQANSPL